MKIIANKPKSGLKIIKKVKTIELPINSALAWELDYRGVKNVCN